MEIFKLFGRILVDDKEAQDSISKTDKKAQTLGDRFKKGIKTAGKWGAAIVAGAAVAGGAMLGAANKAAESTDRIDKLSQKIGISRKAFQEWDFILSQSGTDIEKMQNGLKTLVQRMDESATGVGEGAETFKELGLSATDSAGKMKSQEQMFEETVKTLQGMPEGADKSRLAFEMFGRAGTELMPLLNGAAGSVDEMKKKAEELGLVLSDDAIDSGVKFTDTMDQLKRSMGTAFTQIGVTVMPMLQTFFEWIIANMPVIQGVFSAVFGAFSFAISTAVTWIQTLVSWLTQWYTNNETTLLGIWEAFQLYLGMLIEYWQTIFQTLKTVLEEALNYILPFIQEKLAMLQQFWAENGAQIMLAVQNAFQFIKTIITTIMPVVFAVIQAVWSSIKGVINGALNVIMGIIKVFSGIFTGDMSKLWEGVKQIFKGALEFIWNFINLTLIGRGLGLIRSFWKSGIAIFKSLGTGIVNVFKSLGSSVTGSIRSLFSNAVGIFRNLGSTIGGIASKLLTKVKNVFKGMLSFVTGLGGSFLDAGKGLIDQMAKGIKNAAKKVTDTVKNVAQKVRDFLPFSPAKTGPLSDLDKLDFGGPIADSIDGAESNVKAKMAHMLELPEQEGTNGPGRSQEGGKVENLLLELITAVKEGRNISLFPNGNTFARETGPYTAAEGGNRVRKAERGLAT